MRHVVHGSAQACRTGRLALLAAVGASATLTPRGRRCEAGAVSGAGRRAKPAAHAAIVGITVTWLKLIHEQFGVNPWVFAAIYAITLPPGWYGTWRVVQALRSRNHRALRAWAVLVGVMVLAPYAYVLLAGKNLPWWFYPVLACVVTLSAWEVVRVVRRWAR